MWLIAGAQQILKEKQRAKVRKFTKKIRKWRASVNQAAESKVLEIKAKVVVY